MDKIRIVGFDYDIKKVDMPLVDNQGCFGIVDNIATVIELKKDNPPQKQAETLLHEILHAILFQFDVELEDDKEEKVVKALAKGLHQVVKDNGTEFLSYME